MKRYFFTTFLILVSSVAFAQTNNEGLSLLQFSFQNPGARALAMGGAFVGRADDATAALANPAGLTKLILPEFSFEFAANEFDNFIPYASAEGLADVSSSPGLLQFSNFEYIFHPQEFPSDSQNIAFASFVYPWVEQRVVLSGFYAQQADYNRNVRTDRIRILNRQTSATAATFDATKSFIDLELRNYGLSLSYKATKDLSIGTTFSVYDFEADALNERFVVLDGREAVFSSQSFASEDNGFSFSIGGLYNITENFSVGGVYTKRPEFDANAIFTETTLVEPITSLATPQDVTFRIPDSYSVGVSYTRKFLVLNFDIARLLYSQLSDGYYNAFFQEGVGGGAVEDFESTTLEVEDGTEFRFGGEYTVPIKNIFLAFRAGYWHEPFHSVVHKLDDAQIVQIFTNGAISNDTRGKPFHSRELIQDRDHVTFGMGFSVNRFRFDWAFDYSKDNTKRFVVSTVVLFGSILS